MLLAALPAVLLGACSKGVPATATITSIERTCTIVERSLPDDPEVAARAKGRMIQSERKGRCDEVDEWAEVKQSKSKKIEGEATIHFAYAGPDGKQHVGSFEVTGADDAFYALSLGDSLPIEFDEDQPERNWRA
jgi:hypothetical protein